MTSNDLLGLAITRDAADLWNFYIAVSTAVLAVVASGKVGNNLLLKGLVTLAFVVFAASNIVAILQVTNQRSVLLDAVSETALDGVVASLRPFPLPALAALHGLLDTIVVAAILLVRWPAAESAGGIETGATPT